GQQGLRAVERQRVHPLAATPGEHDGGGQDRPPSDGVSWEASRAPAASCSLGASQRQKMSPDSSLKWRASWYSGTPLMLSLKRPSGQSREYWSMTSTSWSSAHAATVSLTSST